MNQSVKKKIEKQQSTLTSKFYSCHLIINQLYNLISLNAIEQRDDFAMENMEAMFINENISDEKKVGEDPIIPSPVRNETTVVKKPNILDIPWKAPDWDTAKKYADYVQPRKGGKSGQMFEFWKTTTGRHCCLGGCGEQLDMWEEGQISEFGIFGAGISNYFKFLKWLFWLFATLSVISLPALILNIYGLNSTASGLSKLAKTTIGHLATFQSNSTTSISIPGCSNYGIYSISCNLNSYNLAKFYSTLDIIISGVIMVAYFWLIYFERYEEFELDKNTSKF